MRHWRRYQFRRRLWSQLGNFLKLMKQRGRAVEQAEVVDYEDYELDEWDE